ncbi:MAG: aminodeoxychorismate lyase [Gammaproteobacteria bacterium]|nr:MAG: aminodeoxychorismate lyase [Gammaproteobacteria bacterium]
MKQLFYKTIALLLLAGSVTFGWIWMDFNGFMNSRANIPEVGIDLHVVEGATINTISQQLYEAGIIRSVFYPRLAAKLYPELTKLKRGEYFINQRMSPRDIFNKIVSGKVKVYQVRFIEGWKLKDFLEVLSNSNRLSQDLKNYNNKQISAKLSIAHDNPEGWFYPDTYNFHKGASDLEILQAAHKKMKLLLNKYWQERDLDLPYASPYEVLIMASIIEKETGLAGERDRIAGVFIRRLNMNMRLQTDPTVIYGMGDSFDGDIRKRDLLNDTPYNTYRRRGLPPTPIAMPSEASLMAAVHPADGTELYFVAKGDGSHQFSTTLKEHNTAVRRYILNSQLKSQLNKQ